MRAQNKICASAGEKIQLSCVKKSYAIFLFSWHALVEFDTLAFTRRESDQKPRFASHLALTLALYV